MLKIFLYLKFNVIVQRVWFEQSKRKILYFKPQKNTVCLSCLVQTCLSRHPGLMNPCKSLGQLSKGQKYLCRQEGNSSLPAQLCVKFPIPRLRSRALCIDQHNTAVHPPVING